MGKVPAPRWGAGTSPIFFKFKILNSDGVRTHLARSTYGAYTGGVYKGVDSRKSAYQTEL